MDLCQCCYAHAVKSSHDDSVLLGSASVCLLPCQLCAATLSTCGCFFFLQCSHYILNAFSEQYDGLYTSVTVTKWDLQANAGDSIDSSAAELCSVL